MAVSELNINGRNIAFDSIRKINANEAKQAQAEAKAKGLDDVVLSMGSDTFIVSGKSLDIDYVRQAWMFGSGSPAKLDGRDAKIVLVNDEVNSAAEKALVNAFDQAKRNRYPDAERTYRTGADASTNVREAHDLAYSAVLARCPGAADYAYRRAAALSVTYQEALDVGNSASGHSYAGAADVAYQLAADRATTYQEAVVVATIAGRERRSSASEYAYKRAAELANK